MGLIHGTCQHLGYQIGYAGQSDQGRVRRCNEDDILLLAEAGVFAVADGLGGLDGGDIASQTALQKLHDLYTALPVASGDQWPPPGDIDTRPLEEVIATVNTQTYQKKITLGRNMATTLAMVQLRGPVAAIAHVGDSRVYHWRNDTLTRATNDHSLAHELCENKVLTPSQAEHSPHRHILTRAIGAAASVVASIQQRAILPGDTLLLCTDGLTGMLPDWRIAEILRTSPEYPNQTVKHLVDAANDAGGQDNITVILVAIGRLSRKDDGNCNGNGVAPRNIF